MKQTKNIVLIAAAVIIIILLLKYCKGGDVEIKETVVHDTVWKEIKGDTTYIPTIVNHYLPGKAPKPFEKWDTLYIEGQTEVDTLAILRDYHSFNTYSDTQPIVWKDPKDSLIWSWVGEAVIEDTISRNKIVGRKFSYDIKWPEITTTITRTVYDKRVQLYASFGLFGNSKELAAGGSFGLALKTKNDRIIEADYHKVFDGQGYYGLSYKHKISLKKKQ